MHFGMYLYYLKYTNAKKMSKKLFFIIACLLGAFNCFATGEASTYFNIYLPPSNANVGRDVCLIVTALYDSTYFNITDDGADGDTDDSKSGMLMQGQSYVLFIRNNGVNDDAPHAGETASKNDGDYFIITGTKLLFASQATLSDWQHDWVSSFNKTSKGQKFIIYSNGTSSSPNDINVFPYEDSTQVVVRKISTAPTLTQGYTNVNMLSDKIVMQKMLNVGQDIIYGSAEGRNLLTSGETYMIESNKPITIQYGALYQNERDGGGYVPSSNGSSSGDLFYFAVPYQAANEQEIRIVSWSDSNNIQLDRFSGGAWINVSSFPGVNKLKPVDWVGRTLGQTFATVFRVRCTAGKKVSVFEANWMETGSTATSDMATMASSENGTSSGKEFVVYMPPPSSQQNMLDPFTGLKLTQNTHAYIYAKDSTVITVKDDNTNGAKLSRTYSIAAGRYADVNLTIANWKSIYNGTGTTSGPERPYLHIQSTNPVSVMVANTNDNWMMYFGSSLSQSFKQYSIGSSTSSKPGDSVYVVSTPVINGGAAITDVSIQITIGEGGVPMQSSLIDSTNHTIVNGVILTNPGKGTIITFPTITTLDSSSRYGLSTKIAMTALGTDGKLISNNDIVSIETTISGNINGTYQQSSSTFAITNNAANTSKYQFTKILAGTIVTDSINSWNSSWADIDGDYYPDLLVCNYDKGKANYYYKNNANGTFTRATKGNLTDAKLVSTLSGLFADMDNDGVDECITSNNIDKATYIFKKNASGSYNKISAGDLTTDLGYGQTVNVIDYDNDGLLDIFIAEYFPTNMCRLYHNEGGCIFKRINTSEISKIAQFTIGSTWADYDNDGRPDLFVPVGGTVSNPLGKNNFLFHNEGNSRFTKITSGAIVNDSANTTASTWGDYDNDGWLDLFISNASNEKNMLYHNNKDGSFTKIDTGVIVNDKGNWHGCSWVDYDNDGWLDLFVVTNDSVGAKKLYHNEKNGKFTSVGYEVICAVNANTIGTSWCDYDKDGFQDLYITTTGKKPNCLYHNNGNSNSWVNIHLKGIVSNQNAIGAKIYVKCTASGRAMWQMREITSTSGIGSQNEINASFGLGDAALIDSIKIKWPSGITQSMTNVGVKQFLQIDEPGTATVRGRVFVDANTNCSLDSGEVGIANVLLKVTPGDILINTDSAGVYSVRLPIGNYTVTELPSASWSTTCVASSNVSVSAINTVYSLSSIGNTSVSNGPDLSISCGAAAFRRGFKNSLVVSYTNLGNNVAMGNTVMITFPAYITPTSSTPAWTSVNGRTYTWNVSDLAPGNAGAIKLRQTISTNYVIGDSLVYAARVFSGSGDVNSSNDTVIYKGKVVGAIDPNELTVSPTGEGNEGFIFDKQQLLYTVEFENIGNYAAENVIITDLLPDNLDVEDFSLVQSSHSCHFQLVDKKLSIYFDAIDLPYTKQDPEGSKGFAIFKVKPRNNVSPGARIPNQATITFDFELPIKTGEVLNTIYPQTTLSRQNTLFIYPNPTNDICSFRAKSSASGIILKRVLVANLKGDIVLETEIDDLEYTLHLAQFAADGALVISAFDASGNEYTSMVSITK